MSDITRVGSEKVQPEPKASDQTSDAKKNPGKAEYKFQKSYRKANICSKFFYYYGNRVVYSVGKNNGVLKLENVEDIKVDEDETNR